MTDIFLSYSSDDRPFVDQIKRSLEASPCNYSIWMDKYRIKGGDDWEESIRANVCSCKVFVVIVSDSSNKSPWVKRECLLAEQLKKRRIPLRLRRRIQKRSRSRISTTNNDGNDDALSTCSTNGDYDGDEYSECELPFRIMDLQYIDFFAGRNQEDQQQAITASYEKSINSLLEVLSKYLGGPRNQFRRTSSQKSVTFYEADDDVSNGQQMSQHNIMQHDDDYDDEKSFATNMSVATVGSSSTRLQTKRRVSYDEHSFAAGHDYSTETTCTPTTRLGNTADRQAKRKVSYDEEHYHHPNDDDCNQSFAAMSVASGHTSTCTPGLESTTDSSSASGGGGGCGGGGSVHCSGQYILHQNCKYHREQLLQQSPTYNYSNHERHYQINEIPPSPPQLTAVRRRNDYHGRAASFNEYGSSFSSNSNEVPPSPPSTSARRRPGGRAASFDGYSSTIRVGGNHSHYSIVDEEAATKHDLLTVFQAAPLAYISSDDSKPRSMQQAIDFESERDLLNRTLEDACRGSENQIHVEYEKATTDRLGYFLAKGEGRLLHFSCHGHPQYLALEDNWGGLSMLQTSELQNWITPDVSGKLEFVFVSACHSSSIGEAFVNAGVPHVLCCRYDSQLREDAAVEFEKLFYRYLAFDNTLKYAFDMACREIMVNPNIPAEHRAGEVQKFCLLPADKDHNVKIFYQRPLLPQNRRKQYIPPALFPPPPQICIGREVDQYKLLQAIRRSRLVRVSGVRGIGKLALVQSCCRYLNERLHIVGFDEILWIPCPNFHQRTVSPFNLFENVLNMIRDESDQEAVLSFLDKSRECIHKIIEYFLSTGRKTLLVIDSKQFLLRNDIAKLCLFIEDLLKGTQYLKVVVIHQIEFDITTNRMPCSEETVCLDPLDFDSTIALFSRLCPHHQNLSSSLGMSAILENQQEEQDAQQQPHQHRMSRRRLDIFQMVGGGIPSDVHRAAKTMSLPDFEGLMVLVRQKDGHNIFCRSRSELEKKQKEISAEIAEAAERRDFRKAQELQSVFDELEAQKVDFPDIAELKRQFDEMTIQIQLVMSASDWAKAEQLQKGLDKLEFLIQLETDVGNPSDADVLETRASLEAKLLQLEEDYKSACEDNDFARAREIDNESKELKALRNQKPSRADFAMKVYRLKSQLEDAKANRSLDAAEMIYKRLVEVKKKLKLEEEAETALGITVGGTTTNDDGEPEAEVNSPPPPPPPPAQHQNSNDAARPLLESHPSTSSMKSQDPPGLKGVPVLETQNVHPRQMRHQPIPNLPSGEKRRRRQRRESKENDKAKAPGDRPSSSLTTGERGIAGELGTEPPGAVFNEPVQADDATSHPFSGSININDNSSLLLSRSGTKSNVSFGYYQLLPEEDSSSLALLDLEGESLGVPGTIQAGGLGSDLRDNDITVQRGGDSDNLTAIDEIQEFASFNGHQQRTFRQQRALSVDYSEEENDSGDDSTRPGAINVSGDLAPSDGTVVYSMANDDNFATQEEEEQYPIDAEEEEQYPIEAVLVKEQQDLEEVIMDTLRRNTVQAESVAVEETPPTNSPRRMKSLGRFFKKWGKKKKK